MKADNVAAEAVRPRTRDLARGTNQSGVRLYNERLVLSLIRRHASLPKAAIARLTGLSPQTITIIMRQLEADGLVIKQDRQRGKVGQPSVPFTLNPQGAYSIGFKIGRRSCDLILIDFVGTVREVVHETYAFPTPDALLDFVRRQMPKLVAVLPKDHRDRLSGLGIATPFELWNWEEEIGAPRHLMQAWRDVDIRAEIEHLCPWPVYVCNDATAACAAELVFGNGRQYLDFLYVFIGWFIGGGVVLNGNLFPGRTGYAGALGPLPIPHLGADGRITPGQLLNNASTCTLERRIREAGGDPGALWESPENWSAIDAIVEKWIDDIVDGLGWLVASAVSIIDFQAIVIDGAFPPAVRNRITERVRRKLDTFDRQGMAPFTVVEGAVGNRARAIGGACLPYLAKFARDRDVLFKEGQ